MATRKRTTNSRLRLWLGFRLPVLVSGFDFGFDFSFVFVSAMTLASASGLAMTSSKAKWLPQKNTFLSFISTFFLSFVTEYARKYLFCFEEEGEESDRFVSGLFIDRESFREDIKMTQEGH